MADRVSIDLFGDTIFRRRLLAARYRARNMQPILAEIGHDLQAHIAEQFATEGARSGNPWAQLQEWTIRERGSAHPILRDTGGMFAELISPTNLFVSDDEVFIRLTPEEEVKAESHQHGYRNALTGNEVPARPIVDFTDFDRIRMRRKITNYLVNGDKGLV